jgi:ribonuclease J
MPAKHLLFLPLGGSGEIGMNLNLYGYNDQWIMVDLGITFGNELGVEIILPDPAFIAKRRKNLLGLVLTHAHEDHIGAVPYLWEQLRCPVYATPFTLALVKEKLKEAGIEKEVPLHEVSLESSIKLGPFEIDFITITHSIPEPNVLAIKTPAGTVVHTGDWKLDPEPLLGKSTNIKSLKKLGDEGVLALVCDSTNVFVEGRTGSEGEVRHKLATMVKKQKNRVVIACFASNVARLESCAVAAQASHRKMAFVGRSLHKIYQAARKCGYIKETPDLISEEEAIKTKRSNMLMVCTGSQGEPRSALARIASGQHPHIKLEPGDTVIFSSRIIPGNEKAIRAMQENLVEKGIIVVNASYDDTIHVSGHPARDELKDMYEWVKPKILVPVHGENAHLREHAAFGLQQGVPSAIIPRNGSLISLAPGAPKIIEQVESGRLALDGNALVPFSGPQMRDRHRLMAAGGIFVTVMLGKNHHLKEPPSVSLVGVTEEASEEMTIDLIKEAIETAFDNAEPKHLDQDQKIKDLCRTAARRVINATRGKKPTVVTHIVR